MSCGSSKQGIAVSVVAWMLTACGGGGGGNGGGPPPPPQAFTLGGSISGLVGSVVLRNAGGAQFTVSANGAFTLAGTVAAGASYAVAVAVQPELQTCMVGNGSGTAAANVTNIAISCTDATASTLRLSVQQIKTFRFAWSAVPGITHYKLLEAPTLNSPFAQVGADTAATVIEHVVPLHLRVNARYKVQACAGTRCIDSNEVSVSGSLAEVVGYFKAASITAFDNFGSSIALSADGTTLAVGVPFESSNATGVDGDPANDGAFSSGAVYVFARDGAGPVWVQQAYIKASNAEAGDNFGHAVTLDSSGLTLAVGAHFEDDTASNSGAAYVFERSSGEWTERAFLKASNAGQDDQFGSSLALSDRGHLAVGAPRENGGGRGTTADPSDNSVNDAGAVYVFVRDAAQGFAWRQDAYLKASNTGEEDNFGDSLALSADGVALAVGARFEDSGATGVDGNEGDDVSTGNSGAVYVFTHAEQWTQQAYIKASNTGESDQFGEALALSADGLTLAVGAGNEDSAATGINKDQSDETALQAGAAYVFVRLGKSWTQQAYIKASNTTGLSGPGGDRFGNSLALSVDGSILAVGAAGENSKASGIGGDETDNSVANAGAVYVFERSNDSWAQRAYVKSSNTSTSSGYEFGGAVALSGDGTTLATGAVEESGSAPGINGDQNSQLVGAAAAGAVYLY